MYTYICNREKAKYMVHSGKTANSSLVTSASGKCFYQWETNIAIFEMLIFVIVYYKLAMYFFVVDNYKGITCTRLNR